MVQACPVTPEPFEIRFLPDGRAHVAAGPIDLYLAAASAGILLEHPCGSLGTCGRCRVRVIAGAPPPLPADADHLSPAELADGWRLGCQLVLERPASIEVPAVSRSLAGKSFGADLPPAALARPVVGTATVGVPRGARPDAVGLAVDIGTTSLAAALVSLADGSVRASASCLNPQVAFGADVIARIKHAMDQADGLGHLTRAVREGLSTLVTELVESSACDRDAVVAAAVAGNPTMLQAWMGVPLTGLGRSPYEAAWSHARDVNAGGVELPVHPDARVWTFPMIRSHVGGDAVAAAIACELDRPGGARLLVDLGTNSEVLVAVAGRIAATSAAAGPAFEGVSIRHGMRGAPGAVDVVSFGEGGRVLVHAIGSLPPRGICGSGLIDAVAELLRTGVLASSGYLRKPDEIASTPGRALAHRVVDVDGQRGFVVVPADAGVGAPLVLTARDVREVQLAKGSILAAATLSCRHLGLEPSELDEVLVAGAFGNYIRKASAVRIGLAPAVDPEHIRFVGNAAGVGARLALLDRDVRDRARELAGRAEYLDLATHPAYQQVFMAALEFPRAAS
jgi:uncharacterized 2Fe-2S/4Fe-4S cluster protein (DUF4445 family)